MLHLYSSCIGLGCMSLQTAHVRVWSRSALSKQCPSGREQDPSAGDVSTWLLCRMVWFCRYSANKLCFWKELGLICLRQMSDVQGRTLLLKNNLLS